MGYRVRGRKGRAMYVKNRSRFCADLTLSREASQEKLQFRIRPGDTKMNFARIEFRDVVAVQRHHLPFSRDVHYGGHL